MQKALWNPSSVPSSSAAAALSLIYLVTRTAHTAYTSNPLKYYSRSIQRTHRSRIPAWVWWSTITHCYPRTFRYGTLVSAKWMWVIKADVHRRKEPTKLLQKPQAVIVGCTVRCCWSLTGDQMSIFGYDDHEHALHWITTFWHGEPFHCEDFCNRSPEGMSLGNACLAQVLIPKFN